MGTPDVRTAVDLGSAELAEEVLGVEAMVTLAAVEAVVAADRRPVRYVEQDGVAVPEDMVQGMRDRGEQVSMRRSGGYVR